MEIVLLDTDVGEKSICRTSTRGPRNGVLTFAPLSDLFARTTHYLQSDDAHDETSTFVSIDLFEDVIESIQKCAGIDDEAGWWCINQTSGSWFGTGVKRFCEQFRTPHSEQPHLTSLHHHGTAAWIAPVDGSLSGIEAVVVAGDPPRNPGETLKGSIRRPTVSLLLSSEDPVGLSTATRNIDMPFFKKSSDPTSGFEGVATKGEWVPKSATFDFQTSQEDRTVTVQYLGQNDGPDGIELEVTNPYYTDYPQAIADLNEGDSKNGTTRENLVRRLVSYERISAHYRTGTNDNLQDLKPGDPLTVERIDLTRLSGCGMTFAPTNAYIRVRR